MGRRDEDVLGAVEDFAYPPCPGAAPFDEWNGWVEAPDGGTVQAGLKGNKDDAAGQPDASGLKQGEKRTFEEGRRLGLEEGRALEQEANVRAMQSEEERRKREYAKLSTEFSRSNERFLKAMEHEVVHLALAVAKRILRREAQMDPLFLTGVVRVALGQLAANSEVRLCVPEARADLWKEAMALVPNRAVRPVVVADKEMRLGDCMIESAAGSVDLSVHAQLDEIERRFFDRGETGARQAGGARTSASREAER